MYLHLQMVFTILPDLFGVVLFKFLKSFVLFCVTIVSRNLNHFARCCSNTH